MLERLAWFFLTVASFQILAEILFCLSEAI